jgi:predicted transcriptional regulator
VAGFFPDSSVDEYMNWPVITVDQNYSLKDAAQGMIDEKISAFLVTDKNKTAVGIITSEDLLRVLATLLANPSVLGKLSYSPLVGEFLRETQTAGL